MIYNRGLSLLEAMLAITIVSISVFSISSYFNNRVDEHRIDQTILMTQHIMQASTNYYIDYGKWPEDMDVLIPAYLPKGADISPWQDVNEKHFRLEHNNNGVLVVVKIGGRNSENNAKFIASLLPNASINKTNKKYQVKSFTPKPEDIYFSNRSLGLTKEKKSSIRVIKTYEIDQRQATNCGGKGNYDGYGNLCRSFHISKPDCSKHRRINEIVKSAKIWFSIRNNNFVIRDNNSNLFEIIENFCDHRIGRYACRSINEICLESEWCIVAVGRNDESFAGHVLSDTLYDAYVACEFETIDNANDNSINNSTSFSY